jgi:hypothetical protein
MYVLRVSQIQAHCGGPITGECLLMHITKGLTLFVHNHPPGEPGVHQRLAPGVGRRGLRGLSECHCGETYDYSVRGKCRN